jgi:hypothetical protein
MPAILAAIVLIALAPLLSLLAASVIASAGDCVLNEGDVHPCIVAGLDVGGVLSFLFVSGWLAMATLPLGAVALLIWLVAAIVLYVRSRRARSET